MMYHGKKKGQSWNISLPNSLIKDETWETGYIVFHKHQNNCCQADYYSSPTFFLQTPAILLPYFFHESQLHHWFSQLRIVLIFYYDCDFIDMNKIITIVNAEIHLQFLILLSCEKVAQIDSR